jgi:Prolyl oligopeptidase family
MRTAATILLTLTPGLLSAQPDGVKPIPPKGAAVSAEDKAALRAGLKDLKAAIDDLAKDPKAADLLPDVEIYHKAVHYALDYDEMYVDKNRNDINVSKALLKKGMERAAELTAGKPSWPTATGLVVRGYRSKIDGSVQPYGLVVPASFTPGHAPMRLDFWWHGRGEVLTEVNFIDGRQRSAGEFTPKDAFVLHPYGRYCNANKFAGEVDTFECLEHAKKHYPIDENRLVARGFSMGGAACWQFATHFPTVWAAAAPGAGFAETREFLRDFRGDKERPTWWEERLWRLYDSSDYAQNLFNLPTVAYSGEIDGQKQAADVMAREMKKLGMELVHVIGPKTGHSYEKGSKPIINEKIDAIVAKGKPAEPRAEIKFVTYTLRYNRCEWVTVEGLDKHWSKAEVTGKWDGDSFRIDTKGVSELSVYCPTKVFKGSIDGQPLFSQNLGRFDEKQEERDKNKPTVHTFQKREGKWGSAIQDDAKTLHKQSGLQGPIDDAFMDRVLMVRPTGKPFHEKTGAWAADEMKHATTHWRSQFRGDAQVKDDKEVTAKDIAESNLILWGDPSSNALVAKVVEKLPFKWAADGIVFGGQPYDAATHVPILTYPNPLNPKKYVVLNSGFTFREYAYLNNARQIPKLPDYAVVDVTTPPNSLWPGKVVRAGFFGEKWELLKDDGK